MATLGGALELRGDKVRYPENSKLLLLSCDPTTKVGAYIQTLCVMGGGGIIEARRLMIMFAPSCDRAKLSQTQEYSGTLLYRAHVSNTRCAQLLDS